MMYNDKVEEYFFYPKHIGRIDLTESLTAYFGINQKGLVIDLYVQCSEHKVITRACFKARGDPYVIACLEWLCRRLEGLSLDQLTEVNYQVLIEALAIPAAKYPIAIQVEVVLKELLKRIES